MLVLHHDFNFLLMPLSLPQLLYFIFLRIFCLLFGFGISCYFLFSSFFPNRSLSHPRGGSLLFGIVVTPGVAFPAAFFPFCFSHFLTLDRRELSSFLLFHFFLVPDSFFAPFSFGHIWSSFGINRSPQLGSTTDSEFLTFGFHILPCLLLCGLQLPLINYFEGPNVEFLIVKINFDPFCRMAFVAYIRSFPPLDFLIISYLTRFFNKFLIYKS